MNCIHSFSNFRPWPSSGYWKQLLQLSSIHDVYYGICLLSIEMAFRWRADNGPPLNAGLVAL